MYTRVLIAILAVSALPGGAFGAAGEDGPRQYFSGQDLHLSGQELTIYKGPELKNTHVLVFGNSFSMDIGDNGLSSDRAVVLIRTVSDEFRKIVHVGYDARVYLEGNVSIERGKAARTTDLSQIVIERGESLVARFPVSGQVFATADEHDTGSVDALTQVPLYQKAIGVMAPVKSRPMIAARAQVPRVDEVVREFAPGTVRREPEPRQEQPPHEPEFDYPVNISGLGESAPRIEKTAGEDGLNVATAVGRFYLWQKRDEKGGLLEFMADGAVIYYRGDEFRFGKENQAENTSAGGSVESVYFKGNIVMTEGPRTIRADELFYDFQTRKALAVNAEMRSFDPGRGIPIYMRAATLRGISEDVFKAEDVTLTTSEFYLPQMSVNASEMLLTDTTSIDARTGKKLDKGSYDAVLEDVKVKYGNTTILKWPRMRTNFERPDLAIKKLRVGHDSDFGNTIETQWYLARLLGVKEPEGVDSVLGLDYFSKRGPAAGVQVEYNRDDYRGGMVGYFLKDTGEDDLGRISTRENLQPPHEIRGRYSFRHRQYLPYDWQLTAELSYLSDRNFMEAFYRNEFNTGKAQETLLHLKRIKDNWAFSFLAKVRINDFEAEMEELPTVEYHLKGASLWDHKLTFYSDTQVSRFRDRLSNTSTSTAPQQFYTFAFTRNEVDFPILLNTVKVVPYIAGTYAYEDQTGYRTTLDGRSKTPGDDEVVLGELGVRASTMLWKEDQFVKSRFWDLNGMRHIIKPHFEAAFYEATDNTIDMRDTYNFGLSQRWQSRRGSPKNLRSFDWMRLDLDATFLEKNTASSTGPLSTGANTTYGPAAYMWNNPAIPFGVRRTSNLFGLVRDSINADYMWRLSDTTALLSDLNYDIRSGVVQQFDIGMTRYVYPDVSFYLGSRYLRPVIVSVPSAGVFERGSNSVVAAITYALGSRYMAMFSQEYNFDYGKSVRNEVTIMRRYHRMYYGLTFATDESLDRQSIMFSIWPEGVKELGLGRRRSVGMSEMTTDD